MNERSVPVLLDDSWETGGAANARAFFYSLFKRWRLVAGICLGVVAAVAIATWIRPPRYHSTTRLLVKSSRAQWQLTPTDASRITSVTVNDSVINTEISIIKSNELLETALGRLTPDFDKMTEEDKLRAIGGLRHDLRVVSPPQSNIIEVTYTAGNSQRAAQVVNTIADAYLSRHGELHNNAGLVPFYETQMAGFKQEWETASKALEEFMASHGVFDFDSEIASRAKLMHTTENDLGNVLNKINQVTKKIEVVRAQFESQPGKVPQATEVVFNPAVMQMQKHLTSLENQRTSLLQRFTEEDRRVLDKEAEIAVLKQRISSAKQRIISKETTFHNELKQELERRLLTFRSQIKELHIRSVYLGEKVAGLRSRVEYLTKARQQHAELQQAVQTAKSSYTMAGKKLEEAQLAAAMDREKILNVSIAEAGVMPLRADNEADAATLAIALMLGLGLGVAAAVGVEFLRRAIRFEQDVERYLQTQVLAVIPDMRQQVSVK